MKNLDCEKPFNEYHHPHTRGLQAKRCREEEEKQSAPPEPEKPEQPEPEESDTGQPEEAQKGSAEPTEDAEREAEEEYADQMPDWEDGPDLVEELEAEIEAEKAAPKMPDSDKDWTPPTFSFKKK